MKIQLVSHSSVIVDCSDLRIWADPWLVSRVFNDSWCLFPEPSFDSALLDSIDFLWISHEHPDHFNIPTLRSLPDDFKKRVTVLFQQNNSEKMLSAFNRLGFPNHRTLPHRRIVALTAATEVYCYQCGQMDSCLGVRNGGNLALNVNDSPINDWDCKRMRTDIGAPQVLLSQFSIAGYGGFEPPEEHLPRMAREHLEIMLRSHQQLKAGCTLPFASFIVFACEDNAYVNRYANRPRDVFDFFRAGGAEVAVLYPGDVLEVGQPHDSAAALERFDAAYAELERFPFQPTQPTELGKIVEAAARLGHDLREKYPGWLLRRLAPVTAYLPDLDRAIRFSLAEGRVEEIPDRDETDLVVNSQPLFFALSNPFGIQTLGVSARFRLRRSEANWRNHRILMAMYNAEIYLRPRYFFTRANLRYLYQRRQGLTRQIQSRLAYMRGGR
jgi:hypothetical protein